MINSELIIIAYPGGAGGSFLSTAMRSAVYNNIKVIINPALGHCHEFKTFSIPFVGGDSIESFRAEIASIENLDFSKNQLREGHYRNLVCLQQTALLHQYDTFFIKINFDTGSSNHIKFLTEMLVRKQKLTSRLSNDELDLFRIGCNHSYSSWYWVENKFTKEATINLTLEDIFLGSVVDHFKDKFDNSILEKINNFHIGYKKVNQELHADLIRLLD